MSPLQHGEAFMTEDGADTNLGHYEHLVDETSTVSNLTTGKLYWSAPSKESGTVSAMGK